MFQSGLEVLGAASAVLSFLELAVQIVGQIRTAYERQKGITGALDNHYKEIKNTAAIIEIIKKEEVLQTAAVSSELISMKAIGSKLVDYLQVLEPGDKGSVHQLAHQLVHGSKDEKNLAEIVDQLTRGKINLSLCIQVANVGLTRTAENAIVANTAIITRVNDMLQQVFGEGRGLKIAELLKHRSVQGMSHLRDSGSNWWKIENDVVPLSEQDITFLGDEEASFTSKSKVPASSSTSTQILTSRIILNNVTKDQALQINGPIGEKGWWEVSHLEIKDNEATGESIQVNHGTSMDVFEKLLAARAAALSR